MDFYKIMPENMTLGSKQYNTGFNKDDTVSSNGEQAIYFIELKDIHNYLHVGDFICGVALPSSAKHVIKNIGKTFRHTSNMVMLSPPECIYSPNIIKALKNVSSKDDMAHIYKRGMIYAANIGDEKMFIHMYSEYGSTMRNISRRFSNIKDAEIIYHNNKPIIPMKAVFNAIQNDDKSVSIVWFCISRLDSLHAISEVIDYCILNGKYNILRMIDKSLPMKIHLMEYIECVWNSKTVRNKMNKVHSHRLQR